MRTPAERFMAKVKPNWETGCMEWTGAVVNGYGHFRHNGKLVMAHRYAVEEFDGRTIGPGLYALHRCDNRKCVNLDHLFLGTKKDNAADCVAKARNHKFDLFGEDNGSSKLSNANVMAIRTVMADHARDTAKLFGISISHLHDIWSGRKRRLG